MASVNVRTLKDRPGCFVVVLSGRLGWLQGGTRGVKLVEDDKEYGVGEDGEVENSGGGHGEQYG